MVVNILSPEQKEYVDLPLQSNSDQRLPLKTLEKLSTQGVPHPFQGQHNYNFLVPQVRES